MDETDKLIKQIQDSLMNVLWEAGGKIPYGAGCYLMENALKRVLDREPIPEMNIYCHVTQLKDLDSLSHKGSKWYDPSGNKFLSLRHAKVWIKKNVGVMHITTAYTPATPISWVDIDCSISLEDE